jgi:hypothetical protein
VGNLVKNPGGEVPSGGAYITRNVPASAWTQGEADDGKGMQVVRYGGHAYLADKLVSTAVGGGRNYFIGGYPSRLSTAFQVIDVSSAAADIDAGGVKVCLSAYLGGTTTSASSAQIQLTFLSEAESSLGELRIGPVTRGQRLDKSLLLRRASERVVPRNTRQLRVLFRADSAGSNTTYGSADNISVALIKGGSCDPVLVVKCVKNALVATVNPSSVAATQRVRFAVKGGKRTKTVTDGRSPHTARFTMDGLTGALTVTAAVSQKGGGTIALTKKSRRC